MFSFLPNFGGNSMNTPDDDQGRPRRITGNSGPGADGEAHDATHQNVQSQIGSPPVPITDEMMNHRPIADLGAHNNDMPPTQGLLRDRVPSSIEPLPNYDPNEPRVIDDLHFDSNEKPQITLLGDRSIPSPSQAPLANNRGVTPGATPSNVQDPIFRQRPGDPGANISKVPYSPTSYAAPPPSEDFSNWANSINNPNPSATPEDQNYNNPLLGNRPGGPITPSQPAKSPNSGNPLIDQYPTEDSLTRAQHKLGEYKKPGLGGRLKEAAEGFLRGAVTGDIGGALGGAIAGGVFDVYGKQRRKQDEQEAAGQFQEQDKLLKDRINATANQERINELQKRTDEMTKNHETERAQAEQREKDLTRKYDEDRKLRQDALDIKSSEYDRSQTELKAEREARAAERKAAQAYKEAKDKENDSHVKTITTKDGIKTVDKHGKIQSPTDKNGNPIKVEAPPRSHGSGGSKGEYNVDPQKVQDEARKRLPKVLGAEKGLVGDTPYTIRWGGKKMKIPKGMTHESYAAELYKTDPKGAPEGYLDTVEEIKGKSLGPEKVRVRPRILEK